MGVNLFVYNVLLGEAMKEKVERLLQKRDKVCYNMIEAPEEKYEELEQELEQIEFEIDELEQENK
jgi:cell division protein FtsB